MQAADRARVALDGVGSPITIDNGIERKMPAHGGCRADPVGQGPQARRIDGLDLEGGCMTETPTRAIGGEGRYPSAMERRPGTDLFTADPALGHPAALRRRTDVRQIPRRRTDPCLGGEPRELRLEDQILERCCQLSRHDRAVDHLGIGCHKPEVSDHGGKLGLGMELSKTIDRGREDGRFETLQSRRLRDPEDLFATRDDAGCPGTFDQI